jgi:hypothetical protein
MSSLINSKTILSTFLKTKNLYTILQHALTLLRNQNWPKSIISFSKRKRNKMISKFENIASNMVSNLFMSLCVHQFILTNLKTNSLCGPFKQLLTSIVTSNPN